MTPLIFQEPVENQACINNCMREEIRKGTMIGDTKSGVLLSMRIEVLYSLVKVYTIFDKKSSIN